MAKTAHRVNQANSVARMVLAKIVSRERSPPAKLASSANPAVLVNTEICLAWKRAIQPPRDTMQQEQGIQRQLNARKTNGLEKEHRPATNAHVRKAKNEFVSWLYIYHVLFLLHRAYGSFLFIAGTVASSGLTQCNDIDECLRNHRCPADSQCVNKKKDKDSAEDEAGFICKCAVGFQGR